MGERIAIFILDFTIVTAIITASFGLIANVASVAAAIAGAISPGSAAEQHACKKGPKEVS